MAPTVTTGSAEAGAGAGDGVALGARTTTIMVSTARTESGQPCGSGSVNTTEAQ